MGSFCFGFHLGVLNGPLASLAAEMGFAGQPALEGLVCFLELVGYSVQLLAEHPAGLAGGQEWLCRAIAISLGNDGAILCLAISAPRTLCQFSE